MKIVGQTKAMHITVNKEIKCSIFWVLVASSLNSLDFWDSSALNKKYIDKKINKEYNIITYEQLFI